MISIYIHIPFCKSICTYCDFCKLYKRDDWIDRYLDELEKEISENYKNEKVKTLYFGGGTPSCLDNSQIKRLFSITNVFDLDKDCEITFECNLEDLEDDKLKLLSSFVNRLSIGVQTFNDKFINVLGRTRADFSKVEVAKSYFNNINIDLMYGFEGQSLDDLRKDIDMFLSLDVPHISAYNLILEEHTKLYIDNYKNVEDSDYDSLIENILKGHGYKHYEISNYALEGYCSKHNLTYWNNLEYYGFGLGASGYVDNIRYENTRSLTMYLNGKHLCSKHNVSLNEKLQNEFILGLRKIDGISKKDFFSKYGFMVNDIKVVRDLLKDKKLIENKDNVYINPKYIQFSNEILVKFMEKLY